ncbi:reduced male fertility [Striga asiatica]|uniref:Reduced male fertility n=1 Tax=Striga asiatica TaxID=4170 RepID=A0A5A7QTV5_STRAF|nr:reduced male fertility [Striga asiatica]
MGKRLRKPRSICCCISPRTSFSKFHSVFSCLLSDEVKLRIWIDALILYEVDTWTEIAKFLDGRSLVMLAVTCKWFNHVVMEESVWKYACLRDLQVPDPGKATCNWNKLYASAFDGSHSYLFRQPEKHIDWMRIGAFSFDSSAALLTESLIAPLRIPKADTKDQMLQQSGCCLLNNVKTGIWIAGTMQTLDARHIELFLCEGFQDGSWDYEVLGTYNISKHANGASGGIFDIKHLKDRSTSAIFNLKSWVGQPKDWQPKAMITLHAVAVNTNLQENEGLQIKYHAMKSGKDGQIVAIRISQQLL